MIANLELSKKIFDLGLKLDTYFVWVDMEKKEGKVKNSIQKFTHNELENYLSTHKDSVVLNEYPGPQVHELFEVMPGIIYSDDTKYILVLTKLIRGIECSYVEKKEDLTINHKKWLIKESDEISPNAIAKCLIYLLENGYPVLTKK